MKSLSKYLHSKVGDIFNGCSNIRISKIEKSDINSDEVISIETCWKSLYSDIIFIRSYFKLLGGTIDSTRSLIRSSDKNYQEYNKLLNN